MSDVTISAIVPNYNHGALIGMAIRALADQVPPPDEIIVVDDCSTDDSTDVIERLARQCPTLRLIRNETNRGAIGALNRGLEEARGVFVYFGAADDCVEAGLFANLLPALEAHPQAAFACCEALVVDRETGAKTHRPPARPVHRSAFLNPRQVALALKRIDNWMITGAALARRELVLKAAGFDATLAAFADGFLLRRLALQHGCCFVPHVGQVWQVSRSGYSRSIATDPAIGSRVMTTAIDRMRADPVFPTWYAELFERRWRFGVGRLAVEADSINTAVLRDVSASGPLEKRMISIAVAVGGRVGRFGILGWLFLRHRPTSISGLVKTAMMRKFFSA